MKLGLDNPWVKLILFGLAAGIILLLIGLIPLLGTKPVSPKVTIQNATPCLIQGGEQLSVEDFDTGTPQFICGDMTTDTSPVNLTLVIHPADNVWTSVYVIEDDFWQGAISFSINPPLPPGEYRALVMHARTTFADIYFDVHEE